MDRFDVPDQIRSRVDEIYRHDGVEGVFVRLVSVQEYEIRRRHTHPGGGVASHVAEDVLEGAPGMHVRYFHLFQLMLPADQVGEVEREGVQIELLALDRVVQDPVRRDELVVGYLVPLDRVPPPAELEDQTPEAGARDQDPDVVFGRGAPEGADDVLDHGLVAGSALGGAVVRPVAVQLPDRGARFVRVGWLGRVAPVGRPRGLLVLRASGARGSGSLEVDDGRGLGAADAEGYEGRVEHFRSDFGVGVDRVVDAVEGREQVEGWGGEGAPLGCGEGVEVLAAAVRHVVVGCLPVLAVRFDELGGKVAWLFQIGKVHYIKGCWNHGIFVELYEMIKATDT